jgi:hypothetical protein
LSIPLCARARAQRGIDKSAVGGGVPPDRGTEDDGLLGEILWEFVW